MSSPANSPTTNSDDDQSRCSKWSANRHFTPSPNTNTNTTTATTTTPTPLSTPSSLNSAILLDGNSSVKRKSAFLPYRPQATVLTNLQRGNTEATFCPADVTLSFHERAGQGELTPEQVRQQLERLRKNDDDDNANNRDGGDSDASAKTIDFRDMHGFTGLHWAAYYGQQATVELLLDSGANVNAQAPEMVTPLLLASAGGHHEVVRLLLERGANSTHMDIVGNTALMYAAAGNHPHTCNELLSKDPDMTASNEYGDTAYSLAVENGAQLAQAVLEQYLSALLAL